MTPILDAQPVQDLQIDAEGIEDGADSWQTRLPRSLQIALSCGIWLPALLPLLLIIRLGVDVPFLDDWAFVPFLEARNAGNLSLELLTSPHNEHRILFPRLIFLALAEFTGWDLRYQMVVVWLLAVTTAWTVSTMARMTLGESSGLRLPLVFISNLFFFAVIQYESWLLGSQVAVLLTIACTVGALAIAHSELARVPKLLLFITLATISTFSFGNGFLAWFVVLPVLALELSRRALPALTVEDGRRVLPVLGVAAVVSAALVFLYGLPAAAGNPYLLPAMEQPIEVLRYFLVFLGSPLAHGTPVDTLVMAQLVASAALLTLVGLVGYVAYRRDLELLRHTLPWFMLLVFVLLSALAAAVGRVGFGVETAIAPHYTAFSSLLYVALGFLTAIVATDAYQLEAISPSVRVALLCSVATLVLVLYGLTNLTIFESAHHFSRERRADKAALLFFDFLPPNYRRDGFDAGYLERSVATLDALGYIRPGLMDSPDLKRHEVDSSLNPGLGMCGVIEATSIDAWDYHLSGWAVLPWREEPADAVLISYEDAVGRSVIVAVGTVGQLRPDVSSHFRVVRYRRSGWQERLPLTEVPVPGASLGAWAFDATTGRTCRLSSEAPAGDGEAAASLPSLGP